MCWRQHLSHFLLFSTEKRDWKLSQSTAVIFHWPAEVVCRIPLQHCLLFTALLPVFLLMAVVSVKSFNFLNTNSEVEALGGWAYFCTTYLYFIPLYVCKNSCQWYRQLKDDIVFIGIYADVCILMICWIIKSSAVQFEITDKDFVFVLVLVVFFCWHHLVFMLFWLRCHEFVLKNLIFLYTMVWFYHVLSVDWGSEDQKFYGKWSVLLSLIVTEGDTSTPYCGVHQE